MPGGERTLHLGIDIGGTFTDVVAKEGEELFLTKVPTTPENLVEAVRNGTESVVEQADGNRGAIDRFVHGTTAGTNAVIERDGGTVGLLMTDGFRDSLAIGRQKRWELYNLLLDSPRPTFLAPRERRADIRERISTEGEVIKPLNEADVLDAVDTFVDDYGVDSIAVCYLFSFANPTHEKRTEELIREHYPHLFVSRSSRINPKFREYERVVVTAFDAYLRPVIEEYVSRLKQLLDDDGIGCELQIMQSRGGITSADVIIDRPVTTLLSGPAAAVTGAADIGAAAGYSDLITIDMGGTSCDVSLITDGDPHIATEGEILDYPLRLQMVDINTIGAGGGSIAWLDDADVLHVGPESAGADPGPACYGRGGTAPTVTDASLVLGYLNPTGFPGSTFSLDVSTAREAIRTEVADPLGYDVPEAAKAIHDLVNVQMAEQLRLVTIKRGFDPERFSLIAMGGAGPVHAGWLAQELGVPKVLIPRAPGVLSASGLLTADVIHDPEVTFAKLLDEVDAELVESTYQSLFDRGTKAMEKEGVPLDEIHTERKADMQYQQQAFELELDVPNHPVTDELLGTLCDRFHRRHEQVHGHMNESDPVQFINLRTVHRYEPEKVSTSQLSERRSIEATPKTTRDIQFIGDDVTHSVPIYERGSIPTEEPLDGPAVIEQKDTTTLVYPEQSFHLDQHDNIIVSASN